MAIKNPIYKGMVISRLYDTLIGDPDPSVRCTAAESLCLILGEEAIPALLEVSDDANTIVRQKIIEILGKLGDENQMSDNRSINTGGGNYYESINTSSGNYIQGDYINMSQDLSEAAVQIQDLVKQLQKTGANVTEEQIGEDIATQAKSDPAMREKLAKWAQSLGSASVNEVVKGIVKLAIRSAGIPLP